MECPLLTPQTNKLEEENIYLHFEKQIPWNLTSSLQHDFMKDFMFMVLPITIISLQDTFFLQALRFLDSHCFHEY